MFTDIALHPDLESNPASSGYIEATEVQQRAVPLLLEGQDLLVSAPTGSGKTGDRKSTRLNSSHTEQSRMPSSA